MDMHVILTALIICSGVSIFSEACTPPGLTGPSCNRYNFAYMKGANQKENWTSHSAGLAVDDHLDSCTVVNTPVQDPWWQVDLGKNMIVDGIYILLHHHTRDLIQTYTVEVQKDGESNYNMCKAVNGRLTSNPMDIRCQSPLQGRHVRFSVHHQKLNMSICDVGVYGSCVDNSYGHYCEHYCGHCKPSNPVCNKVTGSCPAGCDTGYFNDTCKDICPFGKYGDQCSQNCGKCLHNVTCTRFNGECPSSGACEPGYQSPMCQEDCPNGKYGLGCIDCGNCKIPTCNKVNGTCDVPCHETFNGTCVESPCFPGYKGTDEKCLTECEDGSYGDACLYDCGHCASNVSTTGPCNKTKGQCEFGCAPGYYEDSQTSSNTNQCRRECADGKWGKNCEQTCGHCVYEWSNGTRTDVPCTKSDGSCEQCKTGWQGSLCNDSCTPGTYGYNCRNLCGKCRDNDICDKISGECPGDCQDGYLGTMCNRECQVGFYGNKCSLRCPVNCATNCTVSVGTCVCKDGWTGPKCQDVCPHNHYGRNCEFVCGNCKPGTTCDQGAGHCIDGCDVDWTGLKCDAKVIREEYHRSYGDVIGGTIGGVIVLALIIVLVVWIVWRYKQDKSIHIRELASSLKRMSLRGSKSLRRSLQRLSMRGRRNDQHHLDSNSEAPAMSNGTRGHKPKIPRMYENIHIHSNTLHYDDYSRLYLQLQESKSDGKTLLYDTFQSFMAQRPRDTTPSENGNAGHAYYNTALDDIQVHVDSENDTGTRIPEFLPLGSNLSGFLLINAPAASTQLWNHLQQRQIETIISLGKEASFTWRPGERITIGPDVVECIDVQLHPSHRESKLTVQRQGVRGRRGVRHLECFFWNKGERFPRIPILLTFMERFQHINYAQRERIILVNYTSSQDQAVLFTVVASLLEILNESKRADILRTVATGGKATVKSIRTFDEFKYLHDVIFQYIRTIENNASSTAI